MVDPSDVTKYDRNKGELEEFLLFCIVVAGKTAKTQAKKLEKFLSLADIGNTPFDKVRRMMVLGELEENLRKVGMGQYSKLVRSLSEIVRVEPQTCMIEDLEAITGIGPKTARFFLLHSRKDQKIAVLDTHILKWMRDELGLNVPKSTPSKKKYLELEKIFISHCELYSKDIAELDLEIWNKYSRK